MSTRRITVISTTRNEPGIYQMGGKTWGEIKSTIESDFGSMNNMSATVKETRNTLSVPEAQLPDGDFTIFLTPTKIKAGSDK